MQKAVLQPQSCGGDSFFTDYNLEKKSSKCHLKLKYIYISRKLSEIM